MHMFRLALSSILLMPLSPHTSNAKSKSLAALLLDTHISTRKPDTSRGPGSWCCEATLVDASIAKRTAGAAGAARGARCEWCWVMSAFKAHTRIVLMHWACARWCEHLHAGWCVWRRRYTGGPSARAGPVRSNAHSCNGGRCSHGWHPSLRSLALDDDGWWPHSSGLHLPASCPYTIHCGLVGANASMASL